MLCSDAKLQRENEKISILGEPTENAIIQSGIDNNVNKTSLETIYPRVGEIPFDSSRKLMTTIHTIPNGFRIVTKGAPDILLSLCTKDYNHGNIVELNSIRLEQIKKTNKIMAEKKLTINETEQAILDALASANEPLTL